MSLFPVADSENFVVHYDPVVKQYRVTAFKDGHFWEEFWFDEYKEDDSQEDQEKIMEFENNIGIGWGL